MARIQAQKIRSEIAKDLRDFGRKLLSEGIVLDSSGFENAANECQNNNHGIQIKGHKIDELWGYNLNRMIIRIEKNKLRHLHPSYVKEISLEYSVNVAGLIKAIDQYEDPLRLLNFNIVITAKSEIDNSVYKACLHLDRNIEGENAPVDAHPMYHFHFGGNNMAFNATNYQYGTALFLDSPRLAHKPLDAVLATDFILSNYIGDKWAKLRDIKTGDGEYKNIIERSYHRLWKPYAHSTSHFFGNFQPGQITWKAVDIWPQLLTHK